MAISFTCPECSKTLKTNSEIPEGKKAKCPACGAVFAPKPIREGASAITAKPPLPGPRSRQAPRPFDDEPATEEMPMRKRPRADEDDLEDRPRKRPRRDMDDEELPRKRARRYQEDDADSEDERPRKRARRYDEDDREDESDRPRRRKKKKPAGVNRALLIAIPGILAVAIVFAVTAWVWPGFLTASGGRGTGGGSGGAKATAGLDALLAYAPADVDAFIGGSLVTMRGKPEFMEGFVQGARQQGASDAEINIYKQAEQAVVCILAGKEPKSVAIISFAAPLDAEQVRSVFKAGAGKSVQGKTLFPVNSGPQKSLMAMPTNKIMVIASGMPETQVADLLDGKGGLPGDMTAYAKACASKTLWGMVSFQGRLKNELAAIPPERAKQVPGLPAALPALERCKNATFELDVPADFKFVKAKIELACANDADAGQLEGFVKQVWKEAVQPLFSMAAFIPQAGAAVKAIQEDLNRTFKAQHNGSTVTVTAEITEAAMESIRNAGGKQGGPPGKNFGPKGKFGPRGK